MGCFIHLHLVEKMHLARYTVQDDGTDGCRICFTPREYACGENVHQLDGALLRITEVFQADSANRSMRLLFYRNRGYAYAELI